MIPGISILQALLIFDLHSCISGFKLLSGLWQAACYLFFATNARIALVAYNPICFN